MLNLKRWFWFVMIFVSLAWELPLYAVKLIVKFFAAVFLFVLFTTSPFVFVIMMLMMFFGATLDAGQLWKAFESVARALAVQVIGHKVYEISHEPDEENVNGKRRNQSSVAVELLATRQEWNDLIKRANENGLWLGNMSFIPLGTTRKFVYKFLVVNLDLELLERNRKNKSRD
jgi:hypothetical protein